MPAKVGNTLTCFFLVILREALADQGRRALREGAECVEGEVENTRARSFCQRKCTRRAAGTSRDCAGGVSGRERGTEAVVSDTVRRTDPETTSNERTRHSGDTRVIGKPSL